MRPGRSMLPTSGRGSMATSPGSRPRVSGCRASWSRQGRCRDAPEPTGPLQRGGCPPGYQDPGPAASSERPFCISARQPAPGETRRAGTTTTGQRRRWGSTPSAAHRGRSHGHRTRDPAERPGSNVAPGSRSHGRGDTSPDPDPATEPGAGANSIVDSIRQQSDPDPGSDPLSPQRPGTETSGKPALRHVLSRGSWSARLVVSEEIAGSSPVGSATLPLRGGWSARRPLKEETAGSSPAGPTTVLGSSAGGAPGCYPGGPRFESWSSSWPPCG